MTTAIETDKPARTCRWLSDDPKEALANGGALLQVTVPRRVRGAWQSLTTFYIVMPMPDGFVLLKDEEGDITERYDIDTSFDRSDPTQWSCSCKSREQPACKHCLSVGAALRKIGCLKG